MWKGRNGSLCSRRRQVDECVEMPVLWHLHKEPIFPGAVLVRVAHALQLLCPEQ